MISIFHFSQQITSGGAVFTSEVSIKMSPPPVVCCGAGGGLEQHCHKPTTTTPTIITDPIAGVVVVAPVQHDPDLPPIHEHDPAGLLTQSLLTFPHAPVPMTVNNTSLFFSSPEFPIQTMETHRRARSGKGFMGGCGKNECLRTLDVAYASYQRLTSEVDYSRGKKKTAAGNTNSVSQQSLSTSGVGSQKTNGNNNNNTTTYSSIGNVELAAKQSYRRCYQRLWAIMQKSVICDPLFLSLAFGMNFGMISGSTFYLCLPLHAQDLGLDKSVSGNVLFYTAFADLIGRLSIGFIADSNIFSLRLLCLMPYGFLFMVWISFATWAKTQATMLLCGAVCLFFNGCSVALSGAVLAKELGVDRLSDSMGIFLSGHGILSYVQLTFASYLRDVTLNWMSVFYFTGCTLVIGFSSILFGFLTHPNKM